MKSYKRHLITSALPYANGPIHIGHLAGVYIPSDIYTRYLRIKGMDVISVCGSDEHGVPITIKARQEKVSPQVIVDKYHQQFLNYNQAGLRLGRVLLHVLENHVETDDQTDTTLPRIQRVDPTAN